MPQHVHVSMADLESAAARRPPGYIEDVMSAATKIGDKSLAIPADKYRELVAKYAPGGPSASGPGTELKSLLGRLGIRASATCSCNAYAREMDAWGPDGCESRLGEIVARLRDQAAARKLPFSEFLAKQLVRLAIRRARKKAAK